MAILHTPAFGNGVCVGGWGRNSIDFFFILHLSTHTIFRRLNGGSCLLVMQNGISAQVFLQVSNIY